MEIWFPSFYTGLDDGNHTNAQILDQAQILEKELLLVCADTIEQKTTEIFQYHE